MQRTEFSGSKNNAAEREFVPGFARFDVPETADRLQQLIKLKSCMNRNAEKIGSRAVHPTRK